MTDPTETLPEMPEAEMPAPEPTPAPESAPEGPMTPEQRAEAAKLAKEKKAALDKMTSAAADVLAPFVRKMQNMDWVQEKGAAWNKMKAEKTPEELDAMFGTSVMDTVTDLIPGVPTVKLIMEIFKTEENAIKALLILGAIGGGADERYINKVGNKNFLQNTLLFLLKILAKIDPDAAALDKLVTVGLSTEGFALEVCKKLRQRNAMLGTPASPEVAPAQPVVATVDREREQMSEAVGTPPADHIHDVDEDIAAAA